MRLKRGKGFASYREELEVMNDLSKVFDDLKCRRDWYYWDRILVDGAKAWRDLLARLGFEGDLVSHLPEVKKNYGDDSLPAMLAEIVILIELIAVERTRLERAGGDVSVLIAATVECAHRRERIYWKHGISPDIGMTFEESALKGQKFRPKGTGKATRGRSQRSATRKEGVITLCKRALRKGKGLKRNGDINPSELARIYIDAGYRDIGEQRVRKIIAEAIREGKLV